MPLYEYACGNCGSELELRQSIKDPPRTDCPDCGEESLERLVSQSSFSLKGGGWYADGYGSKAPAKDDASAGKKADGDKKPTDAKAEKSESKTEKSEPKKADSKPSDAKKTGTDG
jgi:putative FmdB family regulatory protein